MMRQTISFTAGWLLLAMLLNGCVQPVQTPPDPKPVCANVGDFSYNCGMGNPSLLTQNGEGSIQVVVTGKNTVQFSQTVQYRPDNYQSPSVILQNSTASTGQQQLSGT